MEKAAQVTADRGGGMLVPPQFSDLIIESSFLVGEGRPIFVQNRWYKSFDCTKRKAKRGMHTVRVKKDELLAKIKANREKHIREYNEACAGYKEAAIAKVTEVFDELKEKIANLKEGHMIELMAVHFGLEVPVSYESHYDRAIGMLEMSVDDILDCTAQEYQQYVMDEWQWKEQFTTTSGNYSGANLQKLLGKRR